MPRTTSKPPSSSLAANGRPALVPAPHAPSRVEPLSVLPVFVPLRGRHVLVAGGGEGAAWKAELLAAAGAHVTLMLAGEATAGGEAMGDEVAGSEATGGGEGFCEDARDLAARMAPDDEDPADDARHAALHHVAPLRHSGAPALREAVAGTVRLVERAWVPGDLAGPQGVPPSGDGTLPSGHGTQLAMALIDTECHAEAAAFAAIARSCGVTVNCIDKPMHCDVLFGSIVNRSPVVVGISTDGAAPILGQAIRRRVEALLPPALADWAGAMARARTRVLAMLPDKSARRAFFERFAEAAFRLPFPTGAAPNATGATPDATGTTSDGAGAASGGAGTTPGGVGATPDAAPILALADEAVAARAGHATGRASAGHVTLVGAGPGDAELLTIKAVRALQSADVVLFDALVSADVLELARREARRMLVGKRAGRESCRQEDINALMLKLAGEGPGGGKRVVRLKSGDPMVFGRAGEEIEALREAGIPHEVVPGVTTAQALAASLGVSLTHRHAARSVRFVTGHASANASGASANASGASANASGANASDANGQLPADLDWRGLADPATTLIVYMGARTAPLIAGRLIAEGTPATTPAIAACAVARPEQREWHGALADLARGIKTLDTNQPIVIAVGNAMGEADPVRKDLNIDARTNIAAI